MKGEVKEVTSKEEKREISEHCSREYWKHDILDEGYFFPESKDPDMFFVVKEGTLIRGTLGLDFNSLDFEKRLSVEETSTLRIGVPAAELMRFSVSCEDRWVTVVTKMLFEKTLDFLEKEKILDIPLVMLTHRGVVNLFETACTPELFCELPEELMREKFPVECRCFLDKRNPGIFKINNSAVKSYCSFYRNNIVDVP